MDDEMFVEEIGNSILQTTKKIIGIAPDYTAFDPEIIIHINSVFMELSELGVGPDAGFEILDKNEKWDSFLPPSPLLNSVKSYMGLKVRLLFDPPTNSTALDSMNRIIERAEWRMTILAEDFNKEIVK